MAGSQRTIQTWKMSRRYLGTGSWVHSGNGLSFSRDSRRLYAVLTVGRCRHPQTNSLEWTFVDECISWIRRAGSVSGRASPMLHRRPPTMISHSRRRPFLARYEIRITPEAAHTPCTSYDPERMIAVLDGKRLPAIHCPQYSERPRTLITKVSRETTDDE